uniref:Uncharacterized protein n=1 Tax=Eutreptiella gymnastica TaxID=73025 RepID=A0A7S1NFQ7_9EUGL
MPCHHTALHATICCCQLPDLRMGQECPPLTPKLAYPTQRSLEAGFHKGMVQYYLCLATERRVRQTPNKWVQQAGPPVHHCLLQVHLFCFTLLFYRDHLCSSHRNTVQALPPPVQRSLHPRTEELNLSPCCCISA